VALIYPHKEPWLLTLGALECWSIGVLQKHCWTSIYIKTIDRNTPIWFCPITLPQQMIISWLALRHDPCSSVRYSSNSPILHHSLKLWPAESLIS